MQNFPRVFLYSRTSLSLFFASSFVCLAFCLDSAQSGHSCLLGRYYARRYDATAIAYWTVLPGILLPPDSFNYNRKLHFCHDDGEFAIHEVKHFYF